MSFAMPFRAFESIMFLVEQAHWYYEVRAVEGGGLRLQPPVDSRYLPAAVYRRLLLRCLCGSPGATLLRQAICLGSL